MNLTETKISVLLEKVYHLINAKIPLEQVEQVEKLARVLFQVWH